MNTLRIKFFGLLIAAAGAVIFAAQNWLPNTIFFSHIIFFVSGLITATGLYIYYPLSREFGKPIDWRFLPNSGKRVGDYYALVAIPARCGIAVLMEYSNAKPKRIWVVSNYPDSLASYLQGRFKKINNATTERAF